MATLRQRRASTEDRYSLSDYVKWVTSGNARFPTTVELSGKSVEPIGDSFVEHVQRVYKRSGVVFACMLIRQSVFAEVSFRFGALDNGRIGALFGGPELDILQKPWPNGTTGELAARMIQDADLAGNFYAVRRGNRLYRRNPQHMSIVLSGNPSDEEFVDVQGYAYQPAGPGTQVHTYLPEEVCHWSPIPDPEAEYRGMSWLTPVLREVQADSSATDHKGRFFANGASPNLVVKTPPDVMTKEQFLEFKAKLESAHQGTANAYKTLYLAPGADVEVVGTDLRQLDFKETQGRDETRIASAAGVPGALIGIKESYQGSTLNAGNYGQARRRFADGTMRPLYRSASTALESVVNVPQARGPARLWFDDSQVHFFSEDRKDAADIESVKATTIGQLVREGFTAESAIRAVQEQDMDLLEHTGLVSVQLQPPGVTAEPARSDDSLRAFLDALQPKPVTRRIERDDDGRPLRLIEEAS